MAYQMDSVGPIRFSNTFDVAHHKPHGYLHLLCTISRLTYTPLVKTNDTTANVSLQQNARQIL
eukprot:scaffold652_cov188-Chaetoceros_neogracile.AAC.16